MRPVPSALLTATTIVLAASSGRRRRVSVHAELTVTFAASGSTLAGCGPREER